MRILGLASAAALLLAMTFTSVGQAAELAVPGYAKRHVVKHKRAWRTGCPDRYSCYSLYGAYGPYGGYGYWSAYTAWGYGRYR